MTLLKHSTKILSALSYFSSREFAGDAFDNLNVHWRRFAFVSISARKTWFGALHKIAAVRDLKENVCSYYNGVSFRNGQEN